METYRKEKYTELLSREITQILLPLALQTPPAPTFLISTGILSRTTSLPLSGVLIFSLSTRSRLNTTYLVGCMLPSCCRCCHCLQCSNWCCSHCGWSRSWAMCQPARAEWQIPRCSANQAWKIWEQMVNNSKRLSQHHNDIYVNEQKHPQ